MTKAIIQVFSKSSKSTKFPICCKIDSGFKKTNLECSMKNGNLNKARKTKNDEFYTLYPDIENELSHYEQHFKDKIVYCNCDNPRVSNFTRYFIINFQRLGLKKLICTGYNAKGHGLQFIYFPPYSNSGVIELNGNGSYDSPECLKFLEEADIVVTNPPFSLFRNYLATLMRYEKKFLIIGNVNAITYKEVFPLIRNNRIWIGCSKRSMDFVLPSGELFNVNACWFTNLDHNKRHEKLHLTEVYDEDKFPKYDNYNVIEVSKTKNIPVNYYGIMGVPITFLDKYNPEQFEIIGIANNIRSICCDCRTIINGNPVYNRILIKQIQ